MNQKSFSGDQTATILRILMKMQEEMKGIRQNLDSIKGELKGLQGEFYEFKNVTMTNFDHVMAELEAIRIDNTIGTHQIRELRIDVDNLKMSHKQ